MSGVDLYLYSRGTKRVKTDPLPFSRCRLFSNSRVGLRKEGTYTITTI